jgi:hypothetical protein
MNFADEHIDFQTQYESSKLSYDWFVEDLEVKLFRPTLMLESPTFPSIDVLETSEWSIKIYFSQYPDTALNQTKLADMTMYHALNATQIEQPINNLTIVIVSHLNKDELKKHQPAIKIDFTIVDENNKIFHKNPLKNIKFLDDTTTQHIVQTISNFQLTPHNDLTINFNCNLSISNPTTNYYKTLTKRFSWTISSYKSLFYTSEKNCVESLKFDFLNDRTLMSNCKGFINANDPATKHRWSIHLYPKGRDERYNGFFSVFLKHLSGPDVVASAEFTISDKYQPSICLIKEIPPQLFTFEQRWGIGNFLNSSEYRWSDTMIISCQLKIINVKTQLIDSFVLNDCLNSNASEFLRKLNNDFKSQRNGDIILCGEDGGDLLKVHKIVLFACSKKFVEMEREIAGNSTRIKDCDLKVLQIPCTSLCLDRFVNYLYQYELRFDYNFDELVELLKFAVDFEVQTLLEDCENDIVRHRLDCKNIYKMFIMEKKYFTRNLERSCFRFIRTHVADCLSDCELGSLLRNDAVLNKVLRG